MSTAPSPPPPDRVDYEWVALAAGLKPAIRIAGTAEELEVAEASYRRLGAEILRSALPYPIRGAPQFVTYVALEADVLPGLAALEAEIWTDDDVPRQTARSRALGLALGYPRCCVDAFCARRDPKRIERITLHDRFRAVRHAWVARPRSLLNVLLLRERVAFVSFEPCRFDCEAATALATRVVEAFAPAHQGWVAWARAELARPVAVDRRGARAILELEGRRIVAARAPRGPGVPPRALDQAFAADLPGRRVDARGRLGRLGRRGLVVEFGPGTG